MTDPIEDRLVESGVETPGCDCGHEGMGEAWHLKNCGWLKPKIKEWEEKLAEALGKPWSVTVLQVPDQAEELAQARETNRRLNRRVQELESELAAYRRAVADWKIDDNGTYVPLRTLGIIAKAAGTEVPERWEMHFARVERLEAAVGRAEELARKWQAAAAAKDDSVILTGVAGDVLLANLEGWKNDE